MKLTGQKLKEKRESVHLTISEVSLATKINPKVLAAMENGDLEHLPAITFLRGFVRSYAGFLKMNVSEVLALFSQEIGEAGKKETAQPLTAEPTAPTPSVDVNGEGSGTLRAFIVGGILVLILLIIGVRSLIQKYERERSIETSAEITAGTIVPLEEKKPTPVPSATPEVNIAVTVNTAIIAPSPTATSTPAAEVAAPTASPTPAPTIAAQPSVVAKPAEPTPTPVPTPASTPVAEKAQPAQKGKRHEIVLEALDNVEVKFKLHGKSEKISLSPNQIHTILADEPITIDVSDGGALNIIDNGRDKGPPGDLGHPKQISVP